MTNFLKPRSTSSKRDELLTAAELAVLQKGISATSIEELIVEVGISKTGFFYHFRNKNELIQALLERTLEMDNQWFDELFSRADRLSDDPLHSFLAFLDILTTEMEKLPDVHPGCLTSVCCYQERLLDQAVHEVAAKILLNWRQRLLERYQIIAEEYPPKVDVDLEALADMLAALIDGAIILSRVVKDKSVLPRQVSLYRQLVEDLFLTSA